MSNPNPDLSYITNILVRVSKKQQCRHTPVLKSIIPYDCIYAGYYNINAAGVAQ